MKIGLIDVDGHNYPNLPLMKISAYHKQKGDDVSWYEPFDGMIKCYDKVYMSKVFSFSPDYERPIYADDIVKGGSGYCITIGEDGREKFDQENNVSLPYEIEHIMPDYSLAVQDKFKDTAFGFMTRGCPRGCEFCIVGKKEGRRPAYKVADLDEFWSGQKNIELLDPNFFSSENWGWCAEQLIKSKATINFNQGIDIRCITKEKAEAISQMKISIVHCAWDRYNDKDLVMKNLEMFKSVTGIDHRRIGCYVLTNFDTTFEQDLERVMQLRGIANPYIMIYEKYGEYDARLKKLQRWCNNRNFFNAFDTLEDFIKAKV